MLGPLAGLASAASWGAGDFAGGIASKRTNVFVIVMLSQILGLAGLLVLAPFIGEAFPPILDLWWGAAAGLAGAVGVTALYASLAAGRMGIAAPITGVIAALLPVSYAWIVVGAPSTWGLAGMALALVGIALVGTAKVERPPPRVLFLALLSGLGFAAFLLLIGLSSGTSFLWTLIAARAGSALVLVVLVLALRPAWGARPNAWLLVAALGDTLGNVFFLLATRLGRLDIAVVLSSLYPVATVALARFVLHERLTRMQAIGAALMLAAIPLIALGG